MAADFTPKTLTAQDRQYLKSIKGSRFGYFGTFMFLGILTVAVFVMISAVFNFSQESFESASERNAVHTSWVAEYEYKQEYYRAWVDSIMGHSSAVLFEYVAQKIFVSASWMLPENVERSTFGFFDQCVAALHFGLLRSLFLVVAWWRLWLLVVLVSIFAGVRSWRVYNAPDVLGHDSQGKLFYSGLRGELKSMSASGMPDQLLPGLAAINSSSPAEGRYSVVGKVLEKHRALNNTNIKLASMLTYYKKWPGYVAEAGEDALLDSFYARTNLLDNAATVLDTALTLRAEYFQRVEAGESLDYQLEDESASAEGNADKLNPQAFGQLLRFAMHRVLTPQMRADLAQLQVSELATIVLGYESGKIMGYTFEAERWMRKSPFIQLCARAVLHSIPEFSKDYTVTEREHIRRALIYGSRRSVFGPVKFALDLSAQSRAARQWVELLMACPHELEAVADSVELYALLYEANQSWTRLILDGVMTQRPEVLNGSLAYGSMFFMPLKQVLQLLRQVVLEPIIARIDELSGVVSNRQQLQYGTASLGREDLGARSAIPAYERVLPPLREEEMRRLAAEHGLPLEDLRAWSALRAVLSAFSWLGRRVGDNTVPDSSVVFLVYKRQGEDAKKNALGLIGSSGMVTIRASRLEDRWGKAWSRNFTSIFSVKMAESKEAYTKLLQGIEELPTLNAEDGDGPTVTQL